MISEEAVKEALKGVMDPEVGLNVVDLGLVYNVEAGEDSLKVDMTMTTRACPMGEHIRDQAEAALKARFPEVKTVEARLVWDPPWSPDMMSEEGRRKLYGG